MKFGGDADGYRERKETMTNLSIKSWKIRDFPRPTSSSHRWQSDERKYREGEDILGLITLIVRVVTRQKVPRLACPLCDNER